MRKLLLFFMQSKLYSYLCKHVIPYIRFSLYYPKFTGIDFKQAQKLIKPCDIILTTDKKKLTSFLIPGVIDHAVLYLGEQGTFDLVEMTHENYKQGYLFDVCKESDRIIIIRCLHFDDNYKYQMIEKALSFKDAVYDYDFEFGVKSLYCSELIYHSDFEHRIKVDLSDIVGLGRQYISPSGLLYSPSVWCVYDSEYEFTNLNGKFIEQKVRGKNA